MIHSKISASFVLSFIIAPIVILMGACSGGGKLKADVYISESKVIVVNNNDGVWSSGRVYLDGPNADLVATLAEVKPGGKVEIPFSEFNEYKNAVSVDQLPVKEVWIEVDGFKERIIKLKDIATPLE